MRRPSTVAAATMLALLAQGCATPKPPDQEYGPIADKKVFGYKDHDNPDGSHTVLIVMPATTTPEQARTLWGRRAEEICPAGVDKRNIFRVDRPEAFNHAVATYNSVGFSSRIAQSLQVEGYVYCTAQAKAPEPAAPVDIAAH